MSGLPVWLLSGLAPQIGDRFGFDERGLGFLLGSYFGMSALFAVVCGRLVARRGWGTAMLIGVACASASLTLVAVSGSLWMLLPALCGLGALGNSIAAPASNSAIAGTVPAGRQATAFGVKQTALPLTTLLAGAAIPLFSHDDLWRWPFAITGVAAAIMALVLLRALRGGAVAQGGAAPSSGAYRNGESRQRADRRRRRVVSPPRPSGALLVLATGAGVATAATMTLGGFLVTYVVSIGVSSSQAGALVIVASILAVVMRIVSGIAADHRAGRHLIVVAAMMASGSVGLVLVSRGGADGILVAGVLIAFGLGFSWNGVFHYAIALHHRGRVAEASGVVQTAMSIGAMVGPVVFGVVAATGFTGAWLAGAAQLALAAILVLTGRTMLPKPEH
ncbi:MFS transporter [Microbacterium sp. NPDC058342]|uniref:MFS transporter n=1 Tax=Microbacterium sp. NPDC058342 TaxID=3346454 RepID=UPI003656A330